MKINTVMTVRTVVFETPNVI